MHETVSDRFNQALPEIYFSVKEISLLQICAYLFAVCDSGTGEIRIAERKFFGSKKDIALPSVCKRGI